jgi:hypothetical protein
VREIVTIVELGLTEQEFIYQPALTERWLALPSDATAPVKQSLLSTLGTQNRQVGNAVAQCVSAVAMVELPAEKWEELMPALLQFAQDQDNVQLRVSTLVTLGFICEVIVSVFHQIGTTADMQNPEILATRSNEILTAVVSGARKEETSTAVQGAAITALFNALEFIRDNFEREVCSTGKQLWLTTGRAQLHYASRLRGDSESIRGCSNWCIPVFGPNHVAILREDELLHGESFVWGMSTRAVTELMSVNHEWYEEPKRKGRSAGYRVLEYSL